MLIKHGSSFSDLGCFNMRPYRATKQQVSMNQCSVHSIEVYGISSVFINISEYTLTVHSPLQNTERILYK